MASVSLIGGRWSPEEYSAFSHLGLFWQSVCCRTSRGPRPSHVGLLFERLDALGPLASSTVARTCGLGPDLRAPHVFEVLSDRAPRFRRLSAPPWETATACMVYGPLEWPRTERLPLHAAEDLVGRVFRACLAACERPWTYLWTTYVNGACPSLWCCDLGRACCLPCDDEATAATAGNCVGFLFVVLAHATKGPGGAPPQDDRAVLRLLGATHPAACGATPLSAFTPAEAVAALVKAGWLRSHESRPALV